MAAITKDEETFKQLIKKKHSTEFDPVQQKVSWHEKLEIFTNVFLGAIYDHYY